MREIQGLAKGDRAIQNHKKGAEIANEDCERNGALFKCLRVEHLIEKRKERAQNRKPEALPRWSRCWKDDNERECHKEEQHCVKQHAIRSVFEKLSARATLQGHLGASQERHCQNDEEL